MSDFYILLYTCLYLSNSPQRTFIIEEQASCFTCPNGKGVLNREWPTEGPASHGERRADPVRLRQGGELPRSSSAWCALHPAETPAHRTRGPSAVSLACLPAGLPMRPAGARDAGGRGQRVMLLPPRAPPAWFTSLSSRGLPARGKTNDARAGRAPRDGERAKRMGAEDETASGCD